MKNLYKILFLFCLFALPASMMAQVTVNSSGLLTVASPTGTSNYINLSEAGQVYSMDMQSGDMVFRPNGSTGDAVYSLKLSDGGNYDATFNGAVHLLAEPSTGIALTVAGDEAIWYNGTYFSWGFGGSDNYFADKVGIGDTDPSAPLHITSTGGNQVRMESASGNGWAGFYAGTSLEGWLENFNDDLNVTSASGELWLRTTSGDDVRVITSGILDVETNEIRVDDAASKYLRFYDGATQTGYVSCLTGTNNMQINPIGGGIYLNSDALINANTPGGTTTFAATGNVGIGITAPAEKLHVVAADDPTIRLNQSGGSGFLEIADLNDNTARFQKTNPAGSALIDYNPLPLDGTSAARFRFFRTTNSTGQVTLEVLRGNNSSQPNARISGNGNSYINSAVGDLGVGITVPAFKLHVNGTAGKPGGGVWAAASDRRLKKNIEEFTDGLEVVRRINPVSFEYNGEAGLIEDGESYVGVIAQEMKKVAPYTVGEWVYEDVEVTGQDESLRETVVATETYLKYDGTAVTYMLVNSVKELAKQNEDLKAELESMKELIAQIQTQIGGTSSDIDNQSKYGQQNVTLNGEGNVAELIQNQPNPFNENTVIKYFLPEGTKGAHMNIFNAEGKVLKTIQINETGAGQINLRANSLPTGNYMYQLVTDAGVVGSKTMVLVK